MGEVDREKKQGALGTTGRRKSVPRALSFTLSTASKLPTTRPKGKEASAEEREITMLHRNTGFINYHIWFRKVLNSGTFSC